MSLTKGLDLEVFFGDVTRVSATTVGIVSF